MRLPRNGLVLAMLAAGCVDELGMEDAGCAIDVCAPGYFCCSDTCLQDGEQCLGACAAVGSGVGAERFLPFVPGSVWVYEVRSAATHQIEDYKHLRLGAEEDLAPFANGRGYRLCREDRSVDDVVQRGSIRWQRDTGAGALWVRNLRYDTTGVVKDELCVPPAVRLDESATGLCVGATFDSRWTSRTVEDPVTCTGGPSACPTANAAVFEKWETMAVDTQVWVPALGDQRALRVRRILDLGGVDEVSDFWFVRGVGKVTEYVPTDEDERLIYFDIPGVGSGGTNPYRMISECTPEWRPAFP
ncbi:MAG: hypothetical protein HYS27_02335 [Deltaproteobacteria bacterium]|nr:hypothetical protein [Deltaproteobacteria bacterium]